MTNPTHDPVYDQYHAQYEALQDRLQHMSDELAALMTGRTEFLDGDTRTPIERIVGLLAGVEKLVSDRDRFQRITNHITNLNQAIQQRERRGALAVRAEQMIAELRKLEQDTERFIRETQSLASVQAVSTARNALAREGVPEHLISTAEQTATEHARRGLDFPKSFAGEQ